MMGFNFLATITAIALAALGLGWPFAGTLLLPSWRISANPDGLLVGRRLGAAYLGMATILFLGRSSGPSDLRTALCAGMLVIMTSLAILGVIEFLTRNASGMILVSSAIEVLLVIGFATVLLGS